VIQGFILKSFLKMPEVAMKQAISISIGSAKRDKTVEIELLGEKVRLERIGTNGDLEKAARKYQELDGKVQAFGVGGADLGLMVANQWYPLHSIQSMVRFVHQTPLVDGTGLKITLEKRVAPLLEERLNGPNAQKRVLVVAGVDRWGLSQAFIKSGYQCIFGDFMFALNLPIPIRSERTLKRFAAVLLPLVSRLPFHWVYPVGEAQEKRTPKWQQYFDWASVIAGDCHYIRRYMPDKMKGKSIVTNTTTPEDVAYFRKAEVKYLITTTPVLDGRSFGTNMMEAGLIAAMGRTDPITYAQPGDYFNQLDSMLDRLNLAPQIQEL
jgi:hypothetical protein